MEKIQDMGIYVEREDGLSPDGKTYLEFTVYPEGPEELDQAFTAQATYQSTRPLCACPRSLDRRYD